MLKKLKESYKRLLKSEEFKHKGLLSGAFLMCEVNKIESTPWQIDFYEKDKDTIISYTLGDKIEVTDNSQVFKNEKVEIEELKLDEIKIEFEKVKEILEELLKKHQEEAIKITIILQKQKIPIWNIIYITQKFNLLNIKIDAISGAVIEDKVVPLLSWEKGNAKGNQ